MKLWVRTWLARRAFRLCVRLNPATAYIEAGKLREVVTDDARGAADRYFAEKASQRTPSSPPSGPEWTQHALKVHALYCPCQPPQTDGPPSGPDNGSPRCTCPQDMRLNGQTYHAPFCRLTTGEMPDQWLNRVLAGAPSSPSSTGRSEKRSG